MLQWFVTGLLLYGLLHLYRLIKPQRGCAVESVRSVLRPLATVAMRSSHFYYPPAVSGVTRISVADAWRDRRLLNRRRRRRRVVWQPKYHRLRLS